jgi:PTS system nitrogen regulatory IIA component
MPIAELIGPDQVVVGLRVADKAQLLAELARRAAPAVALEQAAILKALLAREQLGSTGLGKGFALPHARMERLTRFYALCARLHRPIDYEAIDGKPIDLAILLLTPESAGSQHLATLAALSRPLRDAAFVEQLRRAPDAAALHRLLVGV